MRKRWFVLLVMILGFCLIPMATDVQAFSGMVMPVDGLPGYSFYPSDTEEPKRTSDPRSWYSVVYRGKYSGAWYNRGEGSGSHPGVDIRVDSGTPVKSIADGVVWKSYNSSSWGGLIIIKHTGIPNTPNGDPIWSIYAHLKQRDVAADATVLKGQVIGLSGGAISDPYHGNSTGPHLHFQIDRDKRTDTGTVFTSPYWPSRSVDEADVNPAVVENYTYNPIKFIEERQGGATPYVSITKTIRSDSDDIIDLTSSDPTDGSRDVIFKTIVSNTGNADAHVSIEDNLAGGNYRWVDGAPCSPKNFLVSANSTCSFEYRARYIGSNTTHGTAITNTARITWIDNYYDETTGADYGGHGNLESSQTAYIHNPANPEITAGIDFLESPPYYVGQSITAVFKIINYGGASITYDDILVSARKEGDPDTPYDWQHVGTITLAPNGSYEYEGEGVFSQTGNYIAKVYYKLNGIWRHFDEGSKSFTINLETLEPPSGISASDGTYTDKVRITWNSVSGASYYRIYRNTSNYSNGAEALSNWQSSTTYDDNSASPGQTYYYWVKAATSSSGANSSDFSSYDTGWRKLSPPANVSASDGTYTDKVRITWNSVSGASYYRIYRNTSNYSSSATALSNWQSSTTYDDNSASPGQTYYYWVKAATSSSGANSSDFSSYDTGWIAPSMTNQDSLALVALYNSTDGDNWTNNTNWLTDAPISTWYGITVSNGRVTKIDLGDYPNGNNLSGTIPPEIGNLINLNYLDLGWNQLTGTIPPEIGNLTNLTYLSLESNQLTGTIPPEIGNLTNLNVLCLDYNQLTGTIPSEIWNLTNLTSLWLCGNQLTGTIPPEIGNLTNLTCLILWNNQLTGTIPSEIGNLTNLTRLCLSGNQLTGTIPPEIGNLTNLVDLELGNNQISGSIPSELGNLTKLDWLTLDNNQITGPIPDEIFNLINLRYLYLNSNQLTGNIPSKIGNLTKLYWLNFYSNQLTGTIPPEIGNLTNLNSLSLEGNQLTGTIPPEIGNLTNLNVLCLDYNQLTGTIPSEIGNLTNLTYLYLYNNEFVDLPDLSSLTSLKYLRIQNNKFTFEDIEPNIGVPSDEFIYSPQDSVGVEQDITVNQGSSFTFSVTVGGEHNQYQWLKNGARISGATGSSYTIHSIASSDAGSYTCNITNTVATGLTLYRRPINLSIGGFVSNQDSLALVALYNSTDGDNWTNNTNWLTDAPISTWYGVTVSNGRVTKIDLGGYPDGNNLSGTIPTEIGNLANLTYLDLEYNQLTGTIPPEIGNLTNLIYLDLASNRLTGTIPPEIGNLTNLKSLNLGYNQLTGTIPSEVGDLTNLTDLDLRGNRLTGTIPPEIGNLTSLTHLCLGGNQLTGAIPPEIWNLTNLTYLYLDGNQLTGTIPSEIGNLTNLTYLYLDGNQLTGTIPSEIGNLTNLNGLYLGWNQLTGTIPPEIGNLTNLTSLLLYGNQLTGTIPSEIGNLTNLTWLYLYGNQLTGIPSEIGNLTNLNFLDLNDNEFVDLPDLSSLTSLKNLRIQNNKFTFEDIEPNIGVPSDEFIYSPQDSVGVEQDITVNQGSSFTFSVTVGGEHNQYQWLKNGARISGATGSSYTIHSIASSDAGSYTCNITNTVATELTLYRRPINLSIGGFVSNQDSLALVALYNSTNGDNWTNNTNWLSDAPISTWYGITVSNGRVTKIDLGGYPNGNNLSGTIPPEIGNLTNLTYLDLEYNQLTGTIPSEIGNLTNLTYLCLYHNQLTGTIPSEIGNLTNLTYLNLGWNQLTGTIPPEIGNLTNLIVLYLGDNQLTGTIPSEIGSLTNLTTLDLCYNQLTGSIPSEIGNLTNLRNLYLFNNQLTGTIPPEVGNLVNLILLDFSSNNLTGTIPVEIWNLTNLTSLGLGSNKLTGTIPAEINNLENLTHLFLCYNQLTGSIPPEIGNLINLRYLYIHGNQLTGTIPPEVGNLVNLILLEFSSNNLTGTIPVEIWNLTNLTSLGLGSNKLTGTIPAKINNLENLTDLFLCFNKLTGSIPAELSNLVNLKYIDLRSNRLEDLPNLSALTSLFSLWIENNKFTFEDIEPNIGVPSDEFTYSPQDRVGVEQDTTVNQGSSFTFSVIVGGEHNQYQWLKDGAPISGATDSSYTIPSIASSDAGSYTCNITNTVARELTLYRRPINLTVKEVPAPQNLTATSGDQQVTLRWSPNTEPDLYKYNIYRGNSSPANTLINSVIVSSSTDTFYIDTGLTNGQVYYYRLTAVYITGCESGYSNEASAIPNGPPIWSGIPDTSFAEDDSLVINLSDYVYDDSDLDSTLIITISGGEKITAVIDSLTHITIFSTYPDSSGFSEQFVFTATDPGGLSDTNTININVLPVNDPPYFTDLMPDSISFDSNVRDTLLLTGLVSDIDNPDTSLIWSYVHSSFILCGINDTLNCAIFWVEKNISGKDTVALSVSDGELTAYYSLVVTVNAVTRISYLMSQVPEEYSLHQNYPNPFNPITNIIYSLPVKSKVNIIIYDLLGREIVTLVNDEQEAKYYRITWDAKDKFGDSVPSGMYIYRIVAQSRDKTFVKTKKLLLMR